MVKKINIIHLCNKIQKYATSPNMGSRFLLFVILSLMGLGSRLSGVVVDTEMQCRLSLANLRPSQPVPPHWLDEFTKEKRSKAPLLRVQSSKQRTLLESFDVAGSEDPKARLEIATKIFKAFQLPHKLEGDDLIILPDDASGLGKFAKQVQEIDPAITVAYSPQMRQHSGGNT